jgi:hypothetical protein
MMIVARRRIPFHWLVILVVLGLPLLGRASLAAEPRPWLCRQIPVFSASKSMTWHATKVGGGEWIMTFMHYDPTGGGHDGFTLLDTRDVDGEAEGTLEAGRYFAVALHRAGGHWICPANASDNHDSSAGVISSLCYGEDEDSCDVKFKVNSTGP